jgi:hypothetical protein
MIGIGAPVANIATSIAAGAVFEESQLFIIAGFFLFSF